MPNARKMLQVGVLCQLKIVTSKSPYSFSQPSRSPCCFFDVVLYAVSLFFIFFHLFYGFLMYLIVEFIRRRRGIDCNATGYGAVYVPIFWVLSFRDFTWFGFGYVILATVTVLALLFVLRPNQPEDGPRQQ